MPDFDQLTPQSTLAQAREAVQDARAAGVACPCCDQTVKEYRRSINTGMARSLIDIYQVAAQPGHSEWVHVPTEIGARSREEGKLAYWGLLEEQITRRDDGPRRRGFWRITDTGKAFVEGRITLPKYTYVYNRSVTGFSAKQRVSISDINEGFNLHSVTIPGGDR